MAIVKQILSLATAGFGLVAALAWNNVIQELVNTYIKPYFEKDSGFISLLLYAVLVTVVAVIVTVYLSKLIERMDNRDLNP